MSERKALPSEDLIIQIDPEDQRLRPPTREVEVPEIVVACTHRLGHYWVFGAYFVWKDLGNGRAMRTRWDNVISKMPYTATTGDGMVCHRCFKFKFDCIKLNKVMSATGSRGVLSNHEFIALFLATKGPTRRDDLIAALQRFRWRGPSLTYGTNYFSPKSMLHFSGNSPYHDGKGHRWCCSSDHDLNNAYWVIDILPKQKGIRKKLYTPVSLTARGWVLAGQAYVKAVKALGIKE